MSPRVRIKRPPSNDHWFFTWAECLRTLVRPPPRFVAVAPMLLPFIEWLLTFIKWMYCWLLLLPAIGALWWALLPLLDNIATGADAIIESFRKLLFDEYFTISIPFTKNIIVYSSHMRHWQRRKKACVTVISIILCGLNLFYFVHFRFSISAPSCAFCLARRALPLFFPKPPACLPSTDVRLTRDSRIFLQIYAYTSTLISTLPIWVCAFFYLLIYWYTLGPNVCARCTYVWMSFRYIDLCAFVVYILYLILKLFS